MATIEDKSFSEAIVAKNSAKIMKTSEQSGSESLKIKVYKKRWFMLAIFMIYSGSSTCQWIEYAIITNIVTRYYGVSSLMVDWTAMSFMLYYVIFIFPATYVADRYGLRCTVVLGSGMNCLGAWIKIFSAQPDRFYIAFIGHSVVALMQTLLLPAPGRVAAHWFPASELSTATSIGIFGQQLGVALGFLLTPVIVKNHENLDDVGNDLSRLCWIVAIVTTVGFLLVLLLFQDEPKLPPSEMRAMQKINRTTEDVKFVAPIKELCKNKSFMILCNSYGLNVGILNVLGTLLNQIFLAHFENGEEDAGRIGLALVFTGMIGTVTFGIILDKTHKFKETAVTVYFFTLCGQILFAVFICVAIKWMVYVSAIFLGFFMSGYLAMGYDLCTEYTYPMPENVSAGILNIANNVYGVVLTITLGLLLKTYGDIPMHIGMSVCLLIGFILTVLTEDEQRRQDARRKVQYEGVAKTEEDNIDDVPAEITLRIN